MTTPQAPLGSGFDAQTTPRQVVGERRLDGIVALVTGGSVGIGLETTRALTDAGATVIVPARTEAKARSALTSLAHPERVELETLDLIDPASVDALASRFLATGRPLHLLITNAGIMGTLFSTSARGFESQLATNHLGHFQLAARLWPALVEAGAGRGARVVALSSRGHARASVDLDDPSFARRPYDKWVAYGQSKTANALFALALDARGERCGVRAFSVHPGAVMTDLSRHVPAEELAALRSDPRNTALGYKTPEQGATTTIWCATSPQLDGKGGVYCEDSDISLSVAADHPEPRGVRPWACDPALAERLWSKSEEWTGLRFTAGTTDARAPR